MPIKQKKREFPWGNASKPIAITGVPSGRSFVNSPWILINWNRFRNGNPMFPVKATFKLGGAY